MAAMPPHERSSSADARKVAGSGARSPRHTPEAMTGSEVPSARNARSDPRASAWDDAAWHADDDRAASARARLLLKRRSGSWFGRFGDRIQAIPHGMFGSRWVRFGAISAVAVILLFVSGFAVLWWRLGTGPINLDVVTPWLVRAIEDNLGSDHTVEVGGTQIERAGRIRVAVRIRDIVVRDRSHAVVASAPKAEVKISTTALLSGRLRAQSLNLVGAELSVRVTADGRVIISTGENSRPLATAQTIPAAVPLPRATPTNPLAPASANPAAPLAPAPTNAGGRSGLEGVLAGLEWLDGLSKRGLDGENLDEVGLKNGYLVVEDQRSGNRLKFQNISLSLRRPSGGGVALSLGEEGKNAWSIKAMIGAPADGVRAIEVQTDKFPTKNVQLALGIRDPMFTADFPVSGHLKGEVGRDGLPTYLSGKISAGAGRIISRDTPDYPMDIDGAEITVEWDAARRALVAPLQVVSGTNRVTLLAHLDPPNDTIPNWQLGLSGGTILFGAERGEEPLIFNRIAVRFRFDTDNRRVLVTQADFSNGDISIAGTGALDYSGAEPRMTLGLAGTPMPAYALKRIWPILIMPELREWVDERVDRGTLQRAEIALNAPVKCLVRHLSRRSNHYRGRFPRAFLRPRTAALQERARPRAQQHEFAPSLHPTSHSATNGHPPRPSNHYRGRFPRAFLRPRTAALQERARPRAQQHEFAPSLHPTSHSATNGHPPRPSNHYRGRFPRAFLRPRTAALRERARPRAQQREFAPSLRPTSHSATNGHPPRPSNHYRGRFPRALLRPRTAALRERARPRAQQREFAPSLRPT